jgi:hypothetical protein
VPNIGRTPQSIPNFGTTRVHFSRPPPQSPAPCLILSDRSCGVALNSHLWHDLTATACRATPGYRLRRSSSGSTTLTSLHPGRGRTCTNRASATKTQWLLLRRAQTAPLLRARLSGTRVPPDLSSNSRYDAVYSTRRKASYPPTCHLPATATKQKITSLTLTQFVQSLSNPYYLHHLCVQKYFEDDAFVEWCKYLKYFSQPEYLPFLSYVWRLPFPSLPFPEFHAEKFKSAIVRLTTQRASIDTLAPLSRRWILCSRSSSVRIFLGRMLLRI